jgi:hypothetical protein
MIVIWFLCYIQSTNMSTVVLLCVTVSCYCLFAYIARNSHYRAMNNHLYHLEALNPALFMGAVTGILARNRLFILFIFVLKLYTFVAIRHLRNRELEQTREEAMRNRCPRQAY